MSECLTSDPECKVACGTCVNGSFCLLRACKGMIVGTIFLSRVSFLEVAE